MTSVAQKNSSTPKTVPDTAIRLAGRSQDGIQSIGGFLARLAGRSGFNVMTFMTIPSTIAGGNSVFQVKMGTEEILSVGDKVDILVAFYQNTYEEHKHLLKEGAVLLYDSDEVVPEESDANHFLLAGAPFTKATEKALGGKGRGKNFFVLGILANALQLDIEKLRALINERFAKKGEEVLKNVYLAFDTGYAYELHTSEPFKYQFAKHNKKSDAPQVTMDGNQAMALGLITSGVRYGASYPITPATPIMEILRAELPKYGGIFLQTEDELAAACTAIGMSYAGHLAVTSTSGPGMSLKQEALGYASMAEIPLLVINVQRGGPSTGIPTQVEQSDLMQAIWGSHGDNPRVVMAAKNVEDCFYIPIEAAKIAKKYATPVIVLSDQIMATRIEGFPQPKLEELVIEPKIDLTPREADFKPYDLEKLPNPAAPGTKMLGNKYPTVTGLEHDEDGKPDPGPENHMKQMAKRRKKIMQVADEWGNPEDDVYGDHEGDVLLVGWGSTYGPIREATKELYDQGKAIAHYHMRYINPLPKGLTELFSKFKHILVVEMNDEGIYGYGQLAMHLRAVTCNSNIESITKTDGLTFKVEEIITGINKYLPGFAK